MKKCCLKISTKNKMVYSLEIDGGEYAAKMLLEQNKFLLIPGSTGSTPTIIPTSEILMVKCHAIESGEQTA